MNQIYLICSERIKAVIRIFIFILVYLSRWKGPRFKIKNETICITVQIDYRSFHQCLPRVLDETITSRNNCNGLLLTWLWGRPQRTCIRSRRCLRWWSFYGSVTSRIVRPMTISNGPNVNNRLTVWYSRRVTLYSKQLYKCVIGFCVESCR